MVNDDGCRHSCDLAVGAGHLTGRHGTPTMKPCRTLTGQLCCEQKKKLG